MNRKPEENTPRSLPPIEIGDASIRELCSDEDHSNAEVEEDYFGQLKKLFSSSKNNRNKSPVLGCVKKVVSIGGSKKGNKKS